MTSLRLAIDARGMTRGGREGARALQEVQRESTKTARALDRTNDSSGRIAASFRRLGAAIAAFASVRELLRLADASVQLENRLRVVTGSTEELVQVQNNLFEIAQRTRQPIEAIAQLYSRASIAAGELGASQAELLTFVERIGQGLAIQGSAASQTSGALLQLSQALGSGIVRAEEFNSILEGAFPIAQAAARGLERAGGSVARLRTLIVNGNVTSREFFDAILRGSEQTRDQFARTQTTIGQAFTNLRNSLTRFVGNINETTGASEKLAEAIAAVARNLDLVVGALGGLALAALITSLGRLLPLLGGAATAMSGLTTAVVALRAALTAHPLLALASILVPAGVAIAGVVRQLGGLRDELKTIRDDVQDIDRVVDNLFPSRRPVDPGTLSGQDIAGRIRALQRESDILLQNRPLDFFGPEGRNVQERLRAISDEITSLTAELQRRQEKTRDETLRLVRETVTSIQTGAVDAAATFESLFGRTVERIRKAQAEQRREGLSQLEELRRQFEQEVALLRAAPGERGALRAQFEAERIADQFGIPGTEEIRAIRELARERDRLAAAEAEASRQRQVPMQEMEDSLRRIEEVGRQVGSVLGTAFERAVLAARNLRDVLRSIVDELARIAIRQAGTIPLNDLFSGLFRSIGSAAGAAGGAGATTVPQGGLLNTFGGSAPARIGQGESAGGSIVINNNISGPVSEAQVRQIGKTTRQALEDAQRRLGSVRGTVR